MKMIKNRGDLTDVSGKKEPLLTMRYYAHGQGCLRNILHRVMVWIQTNNCNAAENENDKNTKDHTYQQ